MKAFFNFNSKAFSLMELVLVVSILAILSSISTVFYIRYLENGKLQTMKNQGNMIGKALLNCMFYRDSSDCLLSIPTEDGLAHNIANINRFLKGIELSGIEEPAKNFKNFKASWEVGSSQRNFCFQFERMIRNNKYELCIDVDRKRKLIRSMIKDKNFCCNEINQACVLPLLPRLELIGNVSAKYCKDKGFSNDFNSYQQSGGFSIVNCINGACISLALPPPPSPP